MDHHDDIEDRVAGELRTWARDLLPLEAAVELLITDCGGRLLCGPWTRQDADGHLWLDSDVADADAEKSVLSGGEQRVLAIAMSVVRSSQPVDLSDAVCSLDAATLDAVLTAIAHAGRTNIP